MQGRKVIQQRSVAKRAREIDAMSELADRHSPPSRRADWGFWIFIGAAVIVAAVLFWHWARQGLQSARQANCLGTLKIVGAGMVYHESARGRYPPAYLIDGQGRPMHSWRVLVLPDVGAHDVYTQYRFSEPWNSPHNRTLANGVPLGMAHFHHTYRCPLDDEADDMDVSFLMVVGPGTFSDGPRATKGRDITDGTSHTIAAAETTNSGIHWMEPRDFDFNTMSLRINDPVGMSIRSNHPGVANALMADGSVQSISEDINPEALKALMTIAGGDEFRGFGFPEPR